MQINDTGKLTLRTNTQALLERGFRVIEVDGKTALAGAADIDLGTLCRDQAFDQDFCEVHSFTKPGTHEARGDAAIPKNTKVYTAPGGRVSATQAAGAVLRGITRSECLGLDGLVEVLPLIGS